MILLALLLWAQPADPDAAFEVVKAQASPQELYALLWAMPKGGDIHHHFGLANRPEELLRAATDPAIAKGNEFFTRVKDSGCAGDTLPPIRWLNVQRAHLRQLPDCVRRDFVRLQDLNASQRQEWLSSLILDRRGEGRDEFFERIVARVAGVIRDPNVNLYLLGENLKRYKREGLLYVEGNAGALRAFYQDGQAMPLEEVAQLLRQRLNEPDIRDNGAALRLQYTAIRFQPNAEEQVERAYEFVSRHRDLWVGINIAGREDNDKGYAARLLETFRKMRRRYSGIPLSLHGGEKDSPGDEVRQTLLLGADRIGHGINLISDPNTLLLLRHNRYLIEINLVSNRILEYFPDLDRHPFPEYLRTGIPVCLNTDDPGVWDSNMTDEYFTAVKHFNVTWSEFVQMGRNSLQYSFAQPELKAKLLRQYDASIEAFAARLARGEWREIVRSARPEVSGYARRNLGILASQ